MNIKKEDFNKLCKKYGLTIMCAEDAENALYFCYDLMIAEVDAIKESEPYAVNTINRLEEAAHELFMLIDDAVELYDEEA